MIALTTYADDASVLGALRAGARGYLTKDAGAEQIRAALQPVGPRRGGARPGGPAPLVVGDRRPGRAGAARPSRRCPTG